MTVEGGSRTLSPPRKRRFSSYPPIINLFDLVVKVAQTRGMSLGFIHLTQLQHHIFHFPQGGWLQFDRVNYHISLMESFPETINLARTKCIDLSWVYRMPTPHHGSSQDNHERPGGRVPADSKQILGNPSTSTVLPTPASWPPESGDTLGEYRPP